MLVTTISTIRSSFSIVMSSESPRRNRQQRVNEPVTVRQTTPSTRPKIEIQHFCCDFKGPGQRVRAHSDCKSLPRFKFNVTFHSMVMISSDEEYNVWVSIMPRSCMRSTLRISTWPTYRSSSTMLSPNTPIEPLEVPLANTASLSIV